jgi:hypothetical protein
MKGFLTIAFFVVCKCLQAKDEPKYPVSQIPEDLKKGMYAVIRESHERFEIISTKQSKHYIHKVITILNSKAKRYAEDQVGYDKLTKVLYINAKVYDAEGNLIRKVKNSEIADRSAYDGFSLFSDNRLKELDLTQGQYPYTIDIEYEIEKNFLYSIPSFELYSDDEVSQQITSFELTYPVSLPPNLKLTKLSEPKKQTIGSTEKLSWRFEKVMPEKFEPFMPPGTIPNAVFSPTFFEYDGYPGSMNSWEELGRWQILLNEGRSILPEATKLKVKELTQNLKTPEAKAKALYDMAIARHFQIIW